MLSFHVAFVQGTARNIQRFICTCTAIVMLIKPFVWWRSFCRRDFLKVPNTGQLISSPSCVSGVGLLFSRHWTESQPEGEQQTTKYVRLSSECQLSVLKVGLGGGLGGGGSGCFIFGLLICAPQRILTSIFEVQFAVM